MKNEFFLIEKNQDSNQIISNNLNENFINLSFYKLALKIVLTNNIKIHHGKFLIQNNNFIDLIFKISSPSDYFEKITIVEGWSKKDLNKVLNKNFTESKEIEYFEIIADTYYLNYNSSFDDFLKKTKISLDNIKEEFKGNKLSKKFSFREIMTIGSILEKEGIDYYDKKNIFSVIINRLDKRMKLQIDATVIYSITEGKTKLKRKLNYEDLKIKHKFNTYHIYGLPPGPISYVGLKTIELIFENYKTDYLFYFYNKFEDKHIYSKNYKNHLNKLNAYRAKK